MTAEINLFEKLVMLVVVVERQSNFERKVID